MTTIRRGFALIGGAVLLLIFGSIVVILVFALRAEQSLDRARAEPLRVAGGELDAANRDDRMILRLALAEVAVLMVGGVAAAIVVHRHLYRPLIELDSAIAQFGASSDHDIRAAERGPLEMRRIARSFNGMADELARQDQREATFLAGVAHDLRNPLAVIRGSVELVIDADQMPAPQRTKALARTMRQIDAMERLLSDFLDARGIQSGLLELRPHRHDVCRLATDVTEFFRASSRDHELVIDAPPVPLFALCDAVRMEQVLVNLLSNAIKYSPDGGTVTVGVSRRDAFIALSVSDQGIGIPVEDLDAVFAPFRRANLTRTDIPGTGLGLAISRRIVEAHHGRIEVESEVDSGTTFRVLIPEDAHASIQPEQTTT